MRERNIRTYSELIQFDSFEDRFRYLKLDGSVGHDTFGFDRYMNQLFYQSKEWKDVRNHVIVRDCGCDLGIAGHDIYGKILIHHINPIMPDDVRYSTDFLLNPEYLITTMLDTHNAIHYGSESVLVTAPIERRPNDTCPWKN